MKEYKDSRGKLPTMQRSGLLTKELYADYWYSGTTVNDEAVNGVIVEIDDVAIFVYCDDGRYRAVKK